MASASQSHWPSCERSSCAFNPPLTPVATDRHPIADPSQSRSAAPLLDPLETARGSIPASNPGDTPETQESVEFAWRHGWWKRKRETVAAAIQKLATNSEILERFQQCGANCWVMVCTTDQGRHRLMCDRCRSRWCDACGQERRRTVTKNLITQLCTRYGLATPHAPCKQIRFLTLTMRSAATPLKEQLDRLYSCFGRFRNRAKIKKCIKGGIAFLELTRNRQTGTWHPHLHVLFEGEFLPHALASAIWREVTGDSFIVDIRAIRSVGEAAGYVVKYATKSVNANVWADPEALAEAMVALVGKRTFNSFGTWKPLKLARPIADDLDWEPVCSLKTLMNRARSGDRDSIMLLQTLFGGNNDEPTGSHARDPTSGKVSNVPREPKRS